MSDFRSPTRSQAPAPLSLYHDTNELSTSPVRLDCLFSVMHTLPDNDESLRRCLGDPPHPARPEPAHPELGLPILSLPIIVLPLLALLALALPILTLPLFALPALSLPLLILPLLVHLKVEPAQPESAHAEYVFTKCAHAEPDPLDRARADRAQPESTLPSDPNPSASSAHNLLCSPANIPGIRRFSKTCMTPSTGISDGQLKRRTIASSHESLGPHVRGEFYSSVMIYCY